MLGFSSVASRRNCYRIHGALARHNVVVPGSDLFGVEARLRLGQRLPELPEHTRQAIEQELATLDFLELEIRDAEQRLESIMKVSVEADLLRTLPSIGKDSQHGSDAGNR